MGNDKIIISRTAAGFTSCRFSFFRDQRHRAKRHRPREGQKNALQAAFFFLVVFSYIPHGEHGEKGLFFKRQRQTETRAIAKHAPRVENNGIGAHETPRHNKDTTHGANAPKTPKKGDTRNAHGGRAGATTAGARHGSPRSADGATYRHHHAHTRPREGKL